VFARYSAPVAFQNAATDVTISIQAAATCDDGKH
jgi:hypothetical protein